MLVRIDVTAEDIANGVRMNCTECPIALAVKRVVKEDMPVFVGTDVEVKRRHSDNRRYKVTPPVDADRFIEDFDNGKEVAPLSFELEIPEEYLKEQTDARQG